MFAVVRDTSSHFLIFKLQLEHFIIFNSGASEILLQFMQMYVFFYRHYSTSDFLLCLFMWFYVFSFTGNPTWNVDVFALFNRCFCGRAEIFFFVPIQLKFFEVITAVLFNFGDLTFPQSYSYRSSSVSDNNVTFGEVFFACFEYTVSLSPLHNNKAT